MKTFSIISMWQGFNYNNNFFTDLLKNIYIYQDKNENIDILICGPFIDENDDIFIKNKNCIKILFITEPIEINEPYRLCYNLYKNNYFHIITGCTKNISENKLIKYPLYLLNIDRNSNPNLFNNINEDIKTKDINKKFCCLIATHDTWNTRKPIYEKIKNIGHIECPSNLLNNCSNEELNNIGNVAYIQKFIFHICSENTLTNVQGYITEKLMNCCMGGAIPIYCGWFDEIDEKIFNKNRILFYDPKDEKSLLQVYEKVKELMEDKEKLKNFYQQNVFMNSAYDTFQEMINNFINLFKNI